MTSGIVIHPVEIRLTRALARAAERAGFTWFGVGDSPLLYQEAFLHQMAALQATERLVCGPFVTHFVARHPVVVACALATLESFAPGRVRAVAASGNSAARGLGLKPATRDALKAAFALVRAVWNGRGGTWQGAQIPATGTPARPGPPLFLAGDGPRMAALSAEIADGYVYSGPSRRQIPAWLPSSARPRWLALTATTAERPSTARRALGPMIAAMANRALQGADAMNIIPPELGDDVADLRRRYDYGYHADVTRPRNDAYMSDRLWAYLLDEFAIWGTSDRWVDRLRPLGRAFDGIMVVLPSMTTPRQVAVLGRRLREALRPVDMDSSPAAKGS